MTEDEVPRRRVRYKGTHPRRFQEKYKDVLVGPPCVHGEAAAGMDGRRRVASAVYE